jgi:phosphatidylserine/phosphatidylglycerophosphate/cardiolipin synthase-like enzyme
MLVDGPRDDGAAADKAILVTGSANWSNGAATKYDENTLFMQGYPELVLRMQREFNLLWDHSGDFVYDATLPYEHSTFVIEDASIPDDPAIDVKFTSANFKIRETSFGVTGTNTVSDLLVAGIQGATKSIHIASGHFRSRPVAEAVMAKAAADPSLDIRVMLDGQEYISKSGHDSQTSNLNSCLAAAAGKEGQTRACLDKGFYYGYLASTSGVPVRYKYYAYRWNASYAVQMHNKVMIVDGDELFTGSYNLSDNAEHNTFENMFHFQGPEYSSLVDQYEVTFEKLWELGRAEGVLGKLQETISTSSSIPLVFDPVSLEWQEVTDLKSLIRANCTAVDTAEYRANPTKHMYCPR